MKVNKQRGSGRALTINRRARTVASYRKDVQPGFSARAIAGGGLRGGEPTPRSMYAARYSRGKRRAET